MTRLPLHPDIHALARQRAGELRREAMADALQRLRLWFRPQRRTAPSIAKAEPCRS